MVNPLMNFEPKLERSNPGYDWILKEIATLEPFYFLKLNHGFWERLVQIQKLGYELADIDALNSEQIAVIEKVTGVSDSYFVEDGFLSELLYLFKAYRPQENSFVFVSSLQPWPLSDRVEGTPMQSSSRCLKLISDYVFPDLIRFSHSNGFTGYEFKKALIDNDLSRFFQGINDRKVIVLCNQRNRKIFDHLAIQNLTFIIAHERQARLKRLEIFDDLIEEIANSEGNLPIVVSMVGGALATWLGFKLNEHQANCQYIDVGAAFYAFVKGDAGKRGWMKAYAAQLSNAISSMNLPQEITRLYAPDGGSLTTQLIELANSTGVNEPRKLSLNSEDAKFNGGQVGFTENKAYDFNRLKDYIDFAGKANHRAKGRPVIRLLEKAVHLMLSLSPSRYVIALNSEISARYIAAAVNQVVAGKPHIKWLSSEFSNLSMSCGILGYPVIAPSDCEGRLDLQALGNIPPDTFDGVIYTNVFAQHSNWTDVFSWCKANGKAMFVDNSIGLFDRPAVNLQEDAPIEVISCDHTQPWGGSEGGFLICNEEEAYIARSLTNDGVGVGENNLTIAHVGANYQLSDLAASSILCRLETLESWTFFYQSQERRVKSLIIDSGLSLAPFTGQTQPRSSRAFTPFISPAPVSIIESDMNALCRKSYKPFKAQQSHYFGNERAQKLYENLVCISNNPFNRHISNEEYVELLTSSIVFSR